MDVMVIAVVAVVIAIIAALIALIKRKKIGKILKYAISGLIIGLLVGYFLAPTIISFV
jgi:predicted PurR-regulated permease PerM